MFAGVLLVVLPTVMFGGLSLLTFLAGNSPGYTDNPLRHDLWRAGHAHAGVYLVLSLVMLRYVDEALLSPFWKWLARIGAPIAAILIPAAFFLSVASPSARQPNGLLNPCLPRRGLPCCCRFKPWSGSYSRRAAHGTMTCAVAENSGLTIAPEAASCEKKGARCRSKNSPNDYRV
jgi:hypothetical protein